MNGPVIARAHGRVNLIGEHTDYNGGWVFPTAIPQFTQVKITRREDGAVHASSLSGARELRRGEYRIGEEKLTSSWIDYLQGVTWVLQRAGHRLGGFNVEIESTVPEGSGLSSSAALEIALLKGLREAFTIPVSDVEIARFGQQVENDFVGARVGIMDQMACSFAVAGEALFLDTLHLTFERVKIPLEAVELVIINSGVSHNLSASGEGYNKRRSQCEESARLLKVEQLRDVTEADLGKLDALPDVLKRRAKHVITENGRVHRAVDAFKRQDFVKVGQLFYESHASMRDDYEVSAPEVDLLVELARKERDVFGARLTGGGFGGSIVALVRAGSGLDVARSVHAQYSRETNGKGAILVPDPLALIQNLAQK